MAKQYFQRHVGDWDINIMYVYRNNESGWIVNVVGPGNFQMLTNQCLATKIEAINFIRKAINKKRQELQDGENCLTEVLNDIVFDISQEGNNER